MKQTNKPMQRPNNYLSLVHDNCIMNALSVYWIESQRFPLLQWMKPGSFCVKNHHQQKSFPGLFLVVQIFGFPNNANSYAFSTKIGGHGHANR